MAFSLRHLSVLAYANGFTLWLYKTGADDQASVAAPGFFESAGDMLAGGDMMMVSARDGGRIFSMIADPAGVRATPLL
jgi:hypothetical protein